MCGIVGAVADRDVVPILIEGLRRLEYRGYDSAGVAVLNGGSQVSRLRAVGKVSKLSEALAAHPTAGHLGIAHTRWATHGVPNERNAHPHISRDGVAIVHNGIIENHEELRAELEEAGYEFTSETDTEVIAHRIHHHLDGTKHLFEAVRRRVAELRGAYSLAVMWRPGPGLHRARARRLPRAHRHRREGELRRLGRCGAAARDAQVHHPRGRRRRLHPAQEHRDRGRGRPQGRAQALHLRADRGRRRARQVRALHAEGDPRAAARGRRDALGARRRRAAPVAGVRAGRDGGLQAHRRSVHIVACGTSYHAGIVARYLHRAALPRAVPRRDRERVPLPRSGRARELAVRVDLAVGRDRRHARGAARSRARRGYLVAARDLQRAGELAGAGIGARDADARGPGDRRRLDQGLHDPARRARHARSSRSASTTACRPSARRRWCSACSNCPRCSSRLLALEPVMQRARRRRSSRSITRSSWAAARCSRSRWKAR